MEELAFLSTVAASRLPCTMIGEFSADLRVTVVAAIAIYSMSA